MRNVSDKSCRENENTFYIQQCFSINCAIYEILLKNIVEQDTTDDNIIWHMLIACWINKATDTHSEYVIPTSVPW